MWSDTLLGAERQHVIGMGLWGLVSLITGTGLLLIVWRRRGGSPLLTQFGLQMAVWGAAEALVSVARFQTLALRDLAGATRLDRLVWFGSGLSIGIAMIGAAIAATAWLAGRRMGGVGGGLAVLTHGLALAVLNGQLIGAIQR